MDIFVIPEIEKRRKGKISEGTIISMMQIVFPLDKGALHRFKN